MDYIRKKEEEAKLSECSFKPKINASKSYSRPKKDVFTHLYEDKKEAPEALTTEEMEAKKSKENCTFKPFLYKPGVSKVVNTQFSSKKNADLMNKMMMRQKVARMVAV